MASVQLAAKYTLTGPTGVAAVFNDPTDPNYVGVITDLSGFDSPEVRESADDLVGMDGGIHGDFFYGRRPITMSGIVLNPTTALDRDQKLDKLSAATDALRANSILNWTDNAGVAKFLTLRRQQPIRFTGAWQKEFQLPMVAADPRIYSVALNAQEVSASVSDPSTVGRGFDESFDVVYGPMAPNGQLLVTNAGTTTTFPVLTVTGPGVNPQISNVTTGQAIYLNYTLAAGETLVLDTLNRTVLLNGTSSRYNALDFTNTSWFGLVPGVNDLRIAFNSFTAPAKLAVQWRDAWL